MEARDTHAYYNDQVGGYLAIRRALVFCARPTLWGFAMWGKPTESDIRRLVPLRVLELAEGVAAHASLVDTRRLEAGDPRAFSLLKAYLRSHWGIFRTRVTRLALVRPPGVLGATVAGFFQVAGAPYPVRVFDALADAAAWVRAPELAAVLDGAIEQASETPEVLLALRRWLDGHLERATLPVAARAMARAPRSLQRDLTTARTSFQRELDAARIRLACRLLADTESPLTRIAYDVGCASPQHFAKLFRRVAGVTPSAWRARRRP